MTERGVRKIILGPFKEECSIWFVEDFALNSVGFFMICWDHVQDTVQLFRIFLESCTRIF